MNKQGGVQFNCFSPPVMLATLIIETVLAVYSVWRYKMTVVTRLITLTLLALAAFQLSEFFVCTGYGFRAEQWSRIGFIMITTLPPLGIHMLHQLAGKPRRRLVVAAYATMVAYITVFLTYHAAFIGHKCTGNYVIFQLGAWVGGFYYVYYFGWLLMALGLGARWANELRAKGKSARQKLNTVRGLMIGYLIFLVPTALANVFKPSTQDGIPSIMCGFAVLFALILVLYVLPRAAKTKN
ncbi:MAG: hypothetical protein WA843_01585 [Candidatus Saccharimonadales bacterium]